jgi:hypothetical protein
MSDYGSVKGTFEVVRSGLEALAILAGGWWFLYTTQFKPRIQFDVDCRCFLLDPNQQTYLAEVFFIFENKGFVEHRLYDLSLSVHGLSPVLTPESDKPFSRKLFPRTMIVPARYKWYFVRPGVRQVITHELVIKDPGPLIEIISGFSYEKRADWPHTVRRIFPVLPIASSTSEK